MKLLYSIYRYKKRVHVGVMQGDPLTGYTSLSSPQSRNTFAVLGPKVAFADQAILITALSVNIVGPGITGLLPGRAGQEVRGTLHLAVLDVSPAVKRLHLWSVKWCVIASVIESAITCQSPPPAPMGLQDQRQLLATKQQFS